MMWNRLKIVWLAAYLAVGISVASAETLPGTKLLTIEGDIASKMIDSLDKFLLNELELSIERRAQHWQRDTSSAAAYNKSIEPNRKRLAKILGMRDARIPFDGLQLLATTNQPSLVGRGEGFEVYAVSWPAIKGISGTGLLLRPSKGKPVADVICIPDAGQTPEMLAGLIPGVAPESQFARRLAESGCRVIVPMLMDRENQFSVAGGRKMNLTHREILYRPAFELGRHLIGYELHKVLAVVDWLDKEPNSQGRKISVVGYGEGGLLALFAGALDTRIDVTGVSGYFDSRQRVWDETLDRNVFGLLHEFGGAELASMVAPRKLIVEASDVPDVVIPPGTSGGPGQFTTPNLSEVKSELARAEQLTQGLDFSFQLVVSKQGSGPFGTKDFLSAVLSSVVPKAKLAASGGAPTYRRKNFDPATRLQAQYDEMEVRTQEMLVESPYVRAEFIAKLDRASRDPAKYAESANTYRDYFRNEVIGSFDYPLSDPSARSRKLFESDKVTGYEVMLDVFPGVFAYGIYILPNDLKPGERRPVVVCQHGLEGRPQDVIGEQGYRHYKAFATELAERGFITFAPQNIYIFKDRFRTLQRKANAIKKSLFSIMVPQHQQIINWLKTQKSVDSERIGFYGLSYGGKSAMRIPALVEDYALSICSADFNEWITKNASTRGRYTYLKTGEYEIFEFDLGSTFNYSEMAALICPRPFMVERGHRDGVGSDAMVAYEFAKVKLLYVDLKIPERTEIEYFDGPHSINSTGTFDFLHKHLRWPKPKK